MSTHLHKFEQVCVCRAGMKKKISCPKTRRRTHSMKRSQHFQAETMLQRAGKSPNAWAKASWIFNQVNHSEFCNLNSLESSSSITWLFLASSECTTTDPSKSYYKGILFTESNFVFCFVFPYLHLPEGLATKTNNLFWYKDDLWHLQREDQNTTSFYLSNIFRDNLDRLKFS